MPSFARLIQDAYTSFWRISGQRVKITDPADLSWAQKSWLIQSAGSCELDNSPDDALGGVPGKTFHYEWPELTCHLVRNAAVVGDQGLIYLPDGRLLRQSIFPYAVERVKIRPPLPVSSRVEQPLFHLTGVHHFNRGHFIQEYLPRVVAARETVPDFREFFFLTAPGHREWQAEMLKYLGIPRNRIMEGSHGTLRCERLYVAPLVEGRVIPLGSPAVHQKIQREFDIIPPDDTPQSEILFLSRKDAPFRQLKNEAALIRMTEEKLGPVKVLTFGRLSLEQQVAAIKSAKIIIGVLGQALTPILFVTGKTLVTLLPGTVEKDPFGVAHSSLPLLTGNRSLTFRCGQESINLDDWSFPESHYRELLTLAISRGLLYP